MSGSITIDNGMRILLRRSGRARRMVLRVPRDGSAPVLTLPHQASESEGRAFVESRAGWLAEAFARAPGARLAVAGAALPVEGRNLILTPAAVRTTRIEGETLLLPLGRPVGPVVQGFLKYLAQQRLGAACDRHAAALGRPFRMMVLRDTKSRWGSCSADGRLMFSWRLAMAPLQVLDYVAAHEVAHLAHLDHSPRFWAAVEGLMPDHAVHRAWLRRHGADLMAWQFTSGQANEPGGPMGA